MENIYIKENDPDRKKSTPDWGHLPYLRLKNFTKLKCAKSGAKSGCFATSIVLPTPKNMKLPMRKKIYRCDFQKKLEILRLTV